MSKNIFIGVNNIARKAKSIYIGVNNVARKVKYVYIGDSNNKAQLCYSSGPVYISKQGTNTLTFSPEDFTETYKSDPIYTYQSSDLTQSYYYVTFSARCPYNYQYGSNGPTAIKTDDGTLLDYKNFTGNRGIQLISPTPNNFTRSQRVSSLYGSYSSYGSITNQNITIPGITSYAGDYNRTAYILRYPSRPSSTVTVITYWNYSGYTLQ